MSDQGELLRQYLLGGLETEERSRLEERLIRDEDLFEAAEAAEADLLDDYAHGRLAPEEREQVARLLAASPRSRSRLALIRGLGTIAGETAGRVLPFPAAFPAARRELSRFERAAALAAMLALAVLSFWLAAQRPGPVRPPRIAGAPAPVAAPPAPLPPSRPAPPAATPPPAEAIAESPPPEGPAPRPAAALVIQLALSTLRGEESIPQENVPPGTGRVELHLQLEEADRASYSSFQATVRGAGPELRVADLQPGGIGGRPTLVLELDPKLPEGMYEVEVWGVTASGSTERIATKELYIQRNASATARPHRTEGSRGL